MKNNKKKWIIISVILITVIVLGILAFNIIVDKIFSKVTGSIFNTDLLIEEISGLPDGEGGTIKFDPETVKDLESKVSRKDKVAVLTLLAKALPPEEYAKIMGFLEGGISDEEIEETYSIMKKHLTPEQKKQVKQYYLKYIYLLEKPSE